MWPTVGPMGPVGPRWAPCWPHELFYLGSMGGPQVAGINTMAAALTSQAQTVYMCNCVYIYIYQYIYTHKRQTISIEGGLIVSVGLQPLTKTSAYWKKQWNLNQTTKTFILLLASIGWFGRDALFCICKPPVWQHCVQYAADLAWPWVGYKALACINTDACQTTPTARPRTRGGLFVTWVPFLDD